MSTLAGPKRNPVAINVAFEDHQMTVELADGRIISVRMEWFPSLRDATTVQRANWRFIGGGLGIHWEDLDEDVSVMGLLAG